MSTNEENETKNVVSAKLQARIENNKKITHLYLHDKFIRNIDKLLYYRNLQVLYLHNNDILTINNLESLVTLKHLYLQNNKISKIEGLETLKNLRKLYLGGNQISVIEGLEKLVNLEELHIEKQKLIKGENICFDPRSVFALTETLQLLNIANNNLISIESLAPLKRIKYLNASFNKLSDVEQVVQTIHNWYYLTEVNFIGNPMTKQHRYKDNLIANTFRLDKKDINETTRSFIKRFEYEKSQNKLNHPIQMNVKNLPGSVAPQLQQAVSKSVMKNLSTSLLTTNLKEEGESYIPWQALKPSVSDSGKKIPPLFVKHQRRRQKETKKVHFAMFPEIP